MQHSWRFVETEPGPPTTMLVAECDGCGTVRAREVPSDADRALVFDGDCPIAPEHEPKAAATD
jgi:hypothetical protein